VFEASAPTSESSAEQRTENRLARAIRTAKLGRHDQPAVDVAQSARQSELSRSPAIVP
jgi:hypothetical protein